jgi:hypothetical protein
VIIIEADHPAIGKVAFVGAGMAEVSTSEIKVTIGQHVQKEGGNRDVSLWRFYSLSAIRKGVHLAGWPEIGSSENLSVRSQLAIIY